VSIFFLIKQSQLNVLFIQANLLTEPVRMKPNCHSKHFFEKWNEEKQRGKKSCLSISKKNTKNLRALSLQVNKKNLSNILIVSKRLLRRFKCGKTVSCTFLSNLGSWWPCGQDHQQTYCTDRTCNTHHKLCKMSILRRNHSGLQN
jgi:hypothetical protein